MGDVISGPVGSIFTLRQTQNTPNLSPLYAFAVRTYSSKQSGDIQTAYRLRSHLSVTSYGWLPSGVSFGVHKIGNDD